MVGKMYRHLFFSLVFGSVLGFIVSLLVRFEIPGFLNYGHCRAGFEKSIQNQRPHYLTNELDTKELLFIGVMTARKYLHTRAEAVYNTWGNEVAGKLEFFVGYPKTVNSKLPIKVLPGVQDNEYPPQKKVMTMLRYMHDHYIDDYEWFMRADDDVYVRTEELQKFLRTLNSSTDTVIGQGGVGQKNRSTGLGLLKNECYCIGGPGVIMSRNVLKKIAPNIDECLKDTASTHEDVELGRCLRKFAGVSCLWAKETWNLFQQVYSNQAEAYHGKLNVAKINKAITLHPVKEPAYMFRLHFHFLSIRLSQLKYNIYKNNAVLEMTEKTLSTKPTTRVGKLAFRLRNADFFHQGNKSSELQWEFLTTQRIFDLQSGKHNRKLDEQMVKGLTKVLGKTMKDLDTSYSKIQGRAKKRQIALTEIDYGYVRVNPKHGLQFSFAIHTKIPKVQLRFPWKPQNRAFHRTYAQQPFESLQWTIKEGSQNSEVTVHLIVPLKGKFSEFKTLLKSLRRAFLIPGEKIAVLVVYFPDLSSPKKHLKQFNKYKSSFPGTKFLWVNIDGEFNRAKALQKGVDYFGNNSLLFFSDVDLEFQREFVYRCRGNTIKGKQVYFPIMFSQYNKDVAYFGATKPTSNFIYTKDSGVWRVYGYGNVCIYSNDVKAVGGFDTRIEGWGGEDLDFADKVVKSGLKLFRAPDLGAVHLYHIHVPCNKNLTKNQRDMCQRSTLLTYAPSSGLVNYLMSKQYIQ